MRPLYLVSKGCDLLSDTTPAETVKKLPTRERLDFLKEVEGEIK